MERVWIIWCLWLFPLLRRGGFPGAMWSQGCLVQLRSWVDYRVRKEMLLWGRGRKPDRLRWWEREGCKGEKESTRARKHHKTITTARQAFLLSVSKHIDMYLLITLVRLLSRGGCSRLIYIVRSCYWIIQTMDYEYLIACTELNVLLNNGTVYRPW